MRLSKLIAGAAIVLGAGFALMIIPARYRYSTAGLDTDRLVGETIRHAYARVRWPGDGTVRFGCGEIDYTLEEEDVDYVDLAGRLFHPPERERHRDATWGFGAWNGPEAYDMRGGEHRWARWVSMPAWLPAAVLFGIGSVLRRRSRRGTTPTCETGDDGT